MSFTILLSMGISAILSFLLLLAMLLWLLLYLSLHLYMGKCPQVVNCWVCMHILNYMRSAKFFICVTTIYISTACWATCIIKLLTFVHFYVICLKPLDSKEYFTYSAYRVFANNTYSKYLLLVCNLPFMSLWCS